LLRLAAILPRISDSEREITGVNLRAIVTAMVIALTTPAFADIPDYESMKLMKEADIYGQPIDSVVDQFIELCTISDECNP
jgi:hypothetical protein